ncbi:hypothetical protein [Actinokineospora inagensis]|uniref:hypothetical protein n=1 Tax=Actinokineospora inagensis TaxID=103730 RepID=UPI00040940E7|nr:hypothetical protein [Actinokineospora inagensis]
MTDGFLLANLAAANQGIAHYILTTLDADAYLKPPPAVEEEVQLAEDLVLVAQQLTARARARQSPD